jgi:hypothetical protein
MSVSLLIKDMQNAEQRLVPVATEAIFKSKWLSGAKELGLEWIELMETGFDVTPENRADVLEELGRLREWMERRGDSYELGRLERLVAELVAIRFELGATAFIG